MKSNEKHSVQKKEEDLDLKPPRVSVQHMMSATLSILNFDRGILYTLREMLLRPGRAMRRYLEADRSKFVHPLRFLFLSAAISAFISTQFVFQSGEFKESFISGVEIESEEGEAVADPLNIESESSKEIKSGDESLINDLEKDHEGKPEINAEEIQEKVGGYIIDLINRYFSLILILYVPFAALATYLFFRKNMLYMGEHLALNAFLIGFVNVLYIIFVPLAIIFSNTIIIGIYLLVAASYQLIFYIKVFKRKAFKGFMLSSLAMTFSGIIYFTIVISALGMMLTKYLNTIAPLE